MINSLFNRLFNVSKPKALSQRRKDAENLFMGLSEISVSVKNDCSYWNSSSSSIIFLQIRLRRICNFIPSASLRLRVAYMDVGKVREQNAEASRTLLLLGCRIKNPVLNN